MTPVLILRVVWAWLCFGPKIKQRGGLWVIWAKIKGVGLGKGMDWIGVYYIKGPVWYSNITRTNFVIWPKVRGEFGILPKFS